LKTLNAAIAKLQDSLTWVQAEAQLAEQDLATPGVTAEERKAVMVRVEKVARRTRRAITAYQAAITEWSLAYRQEADQLMDGQAILQLITEEVAK